MIYLRREFVFVLWAVLFCVVLAAPGSAGTIQVRVTVGSANILLEPSPNATLIGRAGFGQVLDVLEKIEPFYKVVLPPDSIGVQKTGYVFQDYVEEIVPEEPDPRDYEAVAPPRSEWEESRSPVVDRLPTSFRSADYGEGGFKAFGGLAGANLSYPVDPSDEWENYRKMKIGFLGGIGFDTGGQLGLNISFLYMPKGVKYSGTLDFYGYSFKFYESLNIDELSSQVLAKMKFEPNSPAYLLGGVEAGLVVSGKSHWKITDIGSGDSESGTEDFKKDIGSIDYGLVFGLGYEIPGRSIPIFLEARYHLGLANLVLKENRRNSDHLRTKTLVFVAGVRL